MNKKIIFITGGARSGKSSFALAMLMIEAGLKIYREMATFEEAAVSEKAE